MDSRYPDGRERRDVRPEREPRRRRNRRLDDLAMNAVIVAVAFAIVSVCVGLVVAIWRAIL